MKTLVSAADLSRDDLTRVIARALEYADALEGGGSVDQLLEGRVLANIFFEPSTRTRLSFELAAKRLGAHVLTLNPGTSSSVKGESLRDTVTTVTSIGADILVVRHEKEGVPETIREWTGVPVLNAGDGAHEHPTQALLDAATLVSRFGDVTGLQLGVVGDIGHSRVAGSLVHVMPVLGVDVMFVGPDGLLPESAPDGISMCDDLDSVLHTLDVVYLLRVQKERGALADPDYGQRFRIDQRRSSLMQPEAVIMHPGPMNRGIEIAADVADGPRSLILTQVRHGVPTRMSVLAEIAEGLQ